MDTRFLETFALVADVGSLAEASRRLGITPAAVAQRIDALEQDLGAVLLARSGRSVRPTDAGYAILEKSRRILADLRELRDAASHDLPSGELRLGAISTALTGLLPPALKYLSSNMPQVEVFLLPGTSADLYQRLVDQDIHAAILVKPPFSVPKTFDWQLLRAERLVLLAPEGCRGEQPDVILKSNPFIRYDRNNWGGRLAEDYFRRSGHVPKEWLELDSLEAIAIMVSNGLGVSIVPEWARPWPEGLKLSIHHLPNTSIHREVGVLAPRSAPTRRLTKALLETLKQFSAADTASYRRSQPSPSTVDP